MEITSPKLTRANELNASVSAKPNNEPQAAVSKLEQAGDNNRAAAIDISKLTSDQKKVAVADENRAASRISPEEVDAFAAKLGEDIRQFPETALAAASGEKLTNKVVIDLLK